MAVTQSFHETLDYAMEMREVLLKHRMVAAAEPHPEFQERVAHLRYNLSARLTLEGNRLAEEWTAFKSLEELVIASLRHGNVPTMRAIEHPELEILAEIYDRTMEQRGSALRACRS